jgi:hypothetical protein
VCVRYLEKNGDEIEGAALQENHVASSFPFFPFSAKMDGVGGPKNFTL